MITHKRRLVKISAQCDDKIMRAKPRLLLKKNLLSIAKSAVGTKIFRKLYFSIDRKKIDVLRDGNLSCAFFVSSLLKILGLVGETHTTVKGLEEDMARHGWHKINKSKDGAVIIYGPKKFKSGETHKHVGVYLGKGFSISNSSKKRLPQIDKWNYRPVEKILWHKKLEN